MFARPRYCRFVRLARRGQGGRDRFGHLQSSVAAAAFGYLLGGGVALADPVPGTALAAAPALPSPATQPQHGGAVPPLPEILPSAPLKSGLTLPPVPPPAAAAPLDEGPRFVLRDVHVEGNTVLDPAAIRAVAAPYLGKPVTTGDLEEIRRQFTLLYINRGYISSGAVIPNQNVANGIVTFRFIEGRVTDIAVTGTKHYRPEYFTSRLEFGAQPPFNVRNMEEEQQILLQDPLLRRLNLELQPGLTPGEARLHADVLESSPYSLSASIADNQSPTVGEVRGQLQGAVANLWGNGDILSAQYGRSDGLNDGAISYSLPLAPDDTRVSLRYDINGIVVVDPSLAPLNITSQYSSISLGLSRPFYRTTEDNLTLGLSFERRRAQSFLLDTPFSFTAGSVNGTTNVTALRFYQDFLDRNADHALALRSTFSFGLPILGDTVTAMGPGVPSGEFFTWLGQAQYVRRIYKDWEAVVRSDLQLSHDPLFPIEQFALGGIETVRGYREYLTVTDNALLASGELRIPLGQVRLPYFADTDDAGVVQLVPFYDYGRGWNVNRTTPYPPDISSVGLGVRWLIGSGTTAELYYGRALREVSVGTSLQDRGIHFRLTTRLY